MALLRICRQTSVLSATVNAQHAI